MSCDATGVHPTRDTCAQKERAQLRETVMWAGIADVQKAPELGSGCTKYSLSCSFSLLPGVKDRMGSRAPPTRERFTIPDLTGRWGFSGRPTSTERASKGLQDDVSLGALALCLKNDSDLASLLTPGSQSVTVGTTGVLPHPKRWRFRLQTPHKTAHEETIYTHTARLPTWLLCRERR